MIVLLWIQSAEAGPARVERQHARKEADQIELLRRGTVREGVAEQAVARYLDAYGHLELRAVERIEAWGATLQPLPTPAITHDPAPTALPDPELPGLAVPAGAAPPSDPPAEVPAEVP